MKQLAVSAVGLDQVAHLSGLHPSVLRRIRQGVVTAIHATTAARILAVPVRPALGARISAVEARQAIRALRREHFDRASIERRLGVRALLPRMPGHAVTLRTQLRLRRQWRLLNQEEAL